jgi:hypothetical protein
MEENPGSLAYDQYDVLQNTVQMIRMNRGLTRRNDVD